jgi:hypothetical protein
MVYEALLLLLLLVTVPGYAQIAKVNDLLEHLKKTIADTTPFKIAWKTH